LVSFVLVFPKELIAVQVRLELTLLHYHVFIISIAQVISLLIMMTLANSWALRPPEVWLLEYYSLKCCRLIIDVSSLLPLTSSIPVFANLTYRRAFPVQGMN
jgi:hypothetical protein